MTEKPGERAAREGPAETNSERERERERKREGERKEDCIRDGNKVRDGDNVDPSDDTRARFPRKRALDFTERHKGIFEGGSAAAASYSLRPTSVSSLRHAGREREREREGD